MTTASAGATTPPYDARAVSNFILDLAQARAVSLTQLQLLKILYFAHGWFLAAYQTPLVKQNFEAWDYGPVVRVVRDSFKGFGKEPITSRAESFDIFTGEFSIVEPNLNVSHAIFVEQIFLAYHVHGGWELSNMTHERGSPWDKIWNPSEPMGRLALRLSEEEIRRHFERLPARFPIIH
jgi:uncharacterized phage-associated protein